MVEYMDLVDDDDRVIGKEARDAVDKDGSRNHRGVNVFLFNRRGELLVPQRSQNRRIFPGCYDFSVSEHVIAGEGYLEAAHRGLREELGLEDAELLEVGYFRPKINNTSCFQKLYKLVYDGKLNYDREGIARIFHFSIDEVKTLVAKRPELFKDDYPILLNWYCDKYR